MLFRLSLKPVGAHHRRAALRVGSCSRKVTVDGAELRQLIQKSAEFVALPVREQRAQIKKRKDDARRRLEERDPRLAKKREREQLKAKQKADALKKKQELAAAKKALARGESLETSDTTGLITSQPGASDANETAKLAEGTEEEDEQIESSAEAAGVNFKFCSPSTWPCFRTAGGKKIAGTSNSGVKPKLKDCGEETLFPLQYSSEHSGANIVKGTVGLRFMYHTRGSVLRGLDEASPSLRVFATDSLAPPPPPPPPPPRLELIRFLSCSGCSADVPRRESATVRARRLRLRRYLGWLEFAARFSS